MRGIKIRHKVERETRTNLIDKNCAVSSVACSLFLPTSVESNQSKPKSASVKNSAARVWTVVNCPSPSDPYSRAIPTKRRKLANSRMNGERNEKKEFHLMR